MKSIKEDRSQNRKNKLMKGADKATVLHLIRCEIGSILIGSQQGEGKPAVCG